MSPVSIEMSVRPDGWDWALRRNGRVMDKGVAGSGDQALQSARLALNTLLDAGLEAELCAEARAGSWLIGRPT